MTKGERSDDGLRMREVSDRLGVPAPTLRSWERRYGVPTTVRSEGGHRRYTADALAQLRLMRDEIARGRSASSAARSVTAMLGNDNPLLDRINLMLEAVADRSSQGVRTALEQSHVDLGLATTVDDVLMPAMRQIGDWWETGRCDVAQEQLATRATRAWLADVATFAPPAADAAPVILACGPRDLHTVGLDALAALLAEQGCASRVLGPPTTEQRLIATIGATSSTAVVLVSHLATQRRPTVDALRAVTAAGCHAFYAGNAFSLARSREDVPGAYLGDSLSAAAAMILTVLAGDARPPGHKTTIPLTG